MKYLEQLEKLNLPKGQWAIFGSGPLVIRGLLAENNDIDIIVKSDVFEVLKKQYSVINNNSN